MTSIYVNALFKFGERHYMEKLLKEGELFMRPIPAFKSMENHETREDKAEGTVQCFQPSKVTLSMEVNGKYEPIKGICSPILLGHPNMADFNIYCLYALLDRTVDPRNKKFGDTFVVFTQANEFIERVKKKLASLGYEHDCRLVEYVDEKEYQGNMGPFRKFSRLNYQNEARFIVKSLLQKNLTIKIGSIEDIAYLGSWGELDGYINEQIFVTTEAA